MTTTSITTIQNLLAAGRIMEAKTLLISEQSFSDSEELQDCFSKIEQHLTKAETLVAQAAAIENEGRIEAARMLYESVLLFVADYPGITEHLNRIDEALLLTRAVQRRSERVRLSQPAVTKKDGKWARMIWIGMGAGLVAAVLLLILIKPQLPRPPKQVDLRTFSTGAPQATPPSVHAENQPPAVSAEKQLPFPATSDLNPLQTPVADDQIVAVPRPEEQQPELVKPGRHPLQAPVANSQTVVVPRLEEQQPELVKPGRHPLQAPVADSQTAIVLQPPVVTPLKPAGFYTVRNNDSLFSIAKNELCNETAWQQIYQLNQDQISDPDQLLPGMILRLTDLENLCPPAHHPSSQKDSRILKNISGNE